MRIDDLGYIKKVLHSNDDIYFDEINYKTLSGIVPMYTFSILNSEGDYTQFTVSGSYPVELYTEDTITCDIIDSLTDIVMITGEHFREVE